MNGLRMARFFLLVLSVGFMASGDMWATGNYSGTALSRFPEVFSDKFNSVIESETCWVPDQPEFDKTWTVLREQSRSYFQKAQNESAPVIMMAGYMDTDISWRYGGRFSMLAWVWDLENDVEFVEIYFQGEPTGVFLHDDGISGDFEAGDSLFGITIEIPPRTVTPGDYQLELRAFDSMDNASDVWPYLTIHD